MGPVDQQINLVSPYEKKKKKKKNWPDTFEFIFLTHFVFNGSLEISHIPKKAVQKR